MSIKFITVALIATIGSLLWAGAGPVHSQNTANSTRRRELTPQEKRGKAFYLRGEDASGQEMMAKVEDLDVPARTLTCAGCHGSHGEGKSEGGVEAGSLTWSSLIKPHEHFKPDVRKHVAFSDSSFGRALTTGLDPSGNRMAAAMPTYPMSQEDVSNLIAYLKRIDSDNDPGVTDTSIVLGIVLPEKAALNGIGQPMGEALKAYFGEINSLGGIFNRKVELRFADGDLASLPARARKLIDEDQVFAMVSGVIAGAEGQIAALTNENEIPFVGPSTLMPQIGPPLNRYIFYLLPGLKEQGRALVTFAGKKAQASPRVAIISVDSQLNRDVTSAMEEQMKSLRWTAPTTTFYVPDKLNVVEFVRDCNQKRIDSVFFVGPRDDASAILKESQTVGWSATWYTMGTLLGGVFGEDAGKLNKVFYAFPTVPGDVSAAGAAEFRSLTDKYKLSSAHVAAQISAIAAAKTIVEALQHSGKDLSRDRLIKALEEINQYDTGLTPKLTFGPNLRIGALGAYVLTMDPEKKTPASVEWVAIQ